MFPGHVHQHERILEWKHCQNIPIRNRTWFNTRSNAAAVVKGDLRPGFRPYTVSHQIRQIGFLSSDYFPLPFQFDQRFTNWLRLANLEFQMDTILEKVIYGSQERKLPAETR